MGYGKQKPPPGSRIDLNYPPLRRCFGFTPLGEGAGSLYTDAVTGVNGQPSNVFVAPTWSPTFEGVGLKFSGSQRVTLGWPSLGGISPNLSLATRFVPSSVSGDQTLIAQWGGSGAEQSVYFALSGTELIAATYAGGAVYLIGITSGLGLAAGVVYTAMLSWVSSTGFLVWLNGRQVAFSYPNAGPVTISQSTTNPPELGNANGSNLLNGSILWAFATRSAFTTDDAMRLHTDPYGMFIKSARRVYSVPSGVVPTATRLLNLRRKMVLAA